MFIDMGGTPGIICYTPNFPIGALDIGVTWYLGANYVSMDADGFTVTFSYVDTTYTIHWKAVG